MITMETISKLPDAKGIIGTREIAAAIKKGNVKKVVIASNCPEFLLEKIGKTKIEKFDGSQKDLGTKLGKPFAVAMVGYDE
jgi:ribosomal protein L30E